ncbi:IclR family transcriptional regulator [Acidaminococcus intestini]|jgi:hypothetical protein|uniref:Glycerol operon regulatory protein n=3 Tax=Acidaminococcus intestini TaxID=187327 RepID=G4Q7F0_ACIIR|nr:MULTISPECIES: IclR family transcriptional regulator [Acidaminococcus]AEQ21488.1 transcriptional regulator [Acidaminococcus intestini RyC-MR95]EEH91436.1 IclR helix-turn-helix domain protein [Acidaminococcus intestini]MCB5829060.1 IclR family transcriptional regulator [Acidaminococcus intestini]MCB6425278.1 IclR family transcriptional regulator [Acidaminococcus intestini]MCB7083994.1 IclR family transcriptional regulator [Acidaminococcus intestini]
MIYLERSLLMVDQSSSPYVNSVLHAVRILELYAAQRRESLSLTGISRALSLHKTTVYRILRTLQHAGWIEQSEKSGQYRLGTGILMVASAVSVHNTVKDLITEALNDLSDCFNETVVVSTLLGHQGVCVDMVQSRHRLSVMGHKGYIVPLHIGASGKMLLAMQDESLRDTLIGELFTEKTKQRILKNQLLAILQDGYAVSRGEVDEGVAAVAVPLHLGQKGYVISLSGPEARLETIGLSRIRDTLLKTVRNLEQKGRMLKS